MRVLLINTSERIGGAAIAASRLMESLKNHGDRKSTRLNSSHPPESRMPSSA